LVTFTIDIRGELKDKKIIESSGFSVLDDAAVTTLEESVPFPPPKEAIELTLPIVFELK